MGDGILVQRGEGPLVEPRGFPELQMLTEPVAPEPKCSNNCLNCLSPLHNWIGTIVATHRLREQLQNWLAFVRHRERSLIGRHDFLVEWNSQRVRDRGVEVRYDDQIFNDFAAFFVRLPELDSPANAATGQQT